MEPGPGIFYTSVNSCARLFPHASPDITASIFMYTRWIDCHLVTSARGKSSLHSPTRPTLGWGGGTRFQRGLGRVMAELVRLETMDV